MRSASACGDLVIARIAAHHLQIDRRGQAEVQDLVGDIGRLEEKRDLRKFLVQVLAQLDGVLGGGAMVVGLERDQDIAVAGSQRGDIAEGQVETAEWDADVIDDGVDFARGNDVADFIVDFGK